MSIFILTIGHFSETRQSAAIGCVRKGIRINAVCPGPIQTGLSESLVAVTPEIVKEMNKKVPMGRMAEPEEVAYAAIWLCSDEASFIAGRPHCRQTVEL